MKKTKFDINKSFELFWREPLSILTEGLFKLVNIQTNIFKTKPSISVELDNKMTQITVVDSEKMYNLFRTVLYKRQLKEKQRTAVKADLAACLPRSRESTRCSLSKTPHKTFVHATLITKVSRTVKK